MTTREGKGRRGWKPGFFRTRRSRRIAMTAAVVAGAALAGWAISLLLYPAPLVSRDQPVTLVIGLPVAKAVQDLEAQGFRVKLMPGREPDPVLPAGYVTWQEPPGELELPEGSQVELTVSEGPPPVTVPDVLQFDVQYARRVLSAAGLSVGRTDLVPSSAEAGVVVATRPTAGTPLRPGATVELVVSRGPGAIRVPDVVGMPEAEARQRLEVLGLRVGLVRLVPAGRNRPGIVTEQRPSAGAMSLRAGRVDLTVTDSRNR